MSFLEKFALIFTNAKYLDSMLTGLRMTIAISVGAAVLGLVLVAPSVSSANAPNASLDWNVPPPAS